MANVKKITADYSATGLTVYAIVRREADGYRLNDADGAFASAPADPFLSLVEDSVIKGRYEVSESRTAWNDGLYTIVVYKQAGGSPSPVADTIIGTGEMYIKSDLEILFDASVASIESQDIAGLQSDVSLMLAMIKNKKYLEKIGLVWHLIIRDDTDATTILDKVLQDIDGNNISDIQAGIITKELASSV
jgi:hypothetical protein